MTDYARAPQASLLTPRRDEGQDLAPYVDALTAYVDRDPGRFHVPGHKGGLAADARAFERLGTALELDIPSCTAGVDLGMSPTPLEHAEALAADAWGARRSWFLVNGSSEGSHAACLAAAQAGSQVIVQRNSHSSTIHGLVTTGLDPVFVTPEVDLELGVAHGVSPDAVASALARAPSAAAVFLVSPTYFGATADVETIAAVAHERGVPLVVDEAWGAHFRFHETLPADALAAGADLVVSGTHKLLGSLTQSAMLHLGHGAPDGLERAVDRALNLVRSTSPSSLLLGSLDAARRQVAVHGTEFLDGALRACQGLRRSIEELPGLRTLDRRMAGQPGVHDFDLFRLTIDIRGTGLDGWSLAALLRERADIHLEVVTERLLVVHFGLGEPVYPQGLRLLEGLSEVLRAAGRNGARRSASWLPAPEPGPVLLSPREAFFAPAETIPLEQAEGRVSTESLMLYPPGIPNVLPGEALTGSVIDHLTEAVRRGATLKGTAGGQVAGVSVVADCTRAL